MPKVRQISIDEPLYAQMCDLRERVLLAPLGWKMAQYLDEAAGREERCEHFVAVMDHPGGPKVVGCAMLLGPEGLDAFSGPKPAGCEPIATPAGARLAKVMQVATDPQLQGQGIGRSVMAAVEARAFERTDDGGMGLDGVYCHAQVTAVGFYEQLGWVRDSERFDEAGIAHFRMMMLNSRELREGDPLETEW